jgi:spermidine synthase
MPRAAFEELDYSMTPLGELILRRRQVLSLDNVEVVEVKLDGRFLMSSLVNDAEIALADLALSQITCNECDVLVGGLGLGYTAQAALKAGNVRSVVVIEYLERVIDWHRRGLVPLAETLTGDPRCRLVHGDFFAAVGLPGPAKARPVLADAATGPFHAILLDIDHSPQSPLHPRHAAFYTADGLRRLRDRLHPGGVFALWSADPPEAAFVADLEAVFDRVRVETAKFYNPLLTERDENTIYVAQAGVPG